MIGVDVFVGANTWASSKRRAEIRTPQPFVQITPRSSHEKQSSPALSIEFLSRQLQFWWAPLLRFFDCLYVVAV